MHVRSQAALLMMPSQPDRIVLTGFMGSGKTTVGRLLAARLGWTFADLDSEISRRCELSVPEIFAHFGEPHFRREESLALADCLERSRLVLALGGGAPETDTNRALLTGSEGTLVVYLFGDFDALCARCLAQSTGPGAVARPLLADADLARDRFRKRALLYAEVATSTLDTNAHSPEDLARAIAESLLSSLAAVERRSKTP